MKLEDKVQERIETFKALNELYEEIHAFMHRVAERKYNEHKDNLTENSMSVARIAMDIRGEYSRLVKVNNEDIQLYQELLNARV